MRVKRLKTIRRHLDFFRHHFGFREPIQLLVDGNFCHVALQAKVHIKEQVPKTLGVKVKELVTPCTLAELQRLGPDFSGALYIARRFEHRRCGHDEPLAAHACIASLVGDGNPNRYMVATQDPNLRAILRQMPSVPILFLQIKTLVLEPPSEMSMVAAKQVETRKTLPREDEQKAIDAAQLALNPLKPRRRRPLAPNPNSIKKKKKKPVVSIPRPAPSLVGVDQEEPPLQSQSQPQPQHEQYNDDESTGGTMETSKKRNRRKIRRRQPQADGPADETAVVDATTEDV